MPNNLWQECFSNDTKAEDNIAELHFIYACSAIFASHLV